MSGALTGGLGIVTGRRSWMLTVGKKGENDEAYEMVKSALSIGYTHIDTAGEPCVTTRSHRSPERTGPRLTPRSLALTL